jgi:hypothetical protein
VRMDVLKGLIMAGSLSVAVAAEAQIMPPIKASTLSKKPVNWPSQLPAERTVIIIGFSQKQQPDIDTWINGLKLKEPGAPAWFEVPLINNPGGIVRWFIDSGMRRGIPSAYDQDHVVTVYTNKKALMRTMGLPNEATIYTLVVSRSGAILARVSGNYSLGGAAQIAKALKP